MVRPRGVEPLPQDFQSCEQSPDIRRSHYLKWSRGQELNLHVFGYEPTELPVLYPATEYSSINGRIPWN